MAQNLKLDPQKRDYVVENGSPVPSDRLEEKVYYALLIPENAWLYGASGQGSLVYTLQNQKRTASIEQRFAQYAKQAIERQVIASGFASSQSFENVEATRTGTLNKIEAVASQTGVSTRLNFDAV